MTNTKSRIISVFLILALVLTVNTVPAFAASKSNLNLSVKATGQHTVALKWNKVSKAYNGYAIFRNGEVIKYGNSKTLKFTDSKLKAGTKYTYQVKTYKVKKVKNKNIFYSFFQFFIIKIKKIIQPWLNFLCYIL